MLGNDAFLHGACNAIPGDFPVVLQGKLVKVNNIRDSF
jgi:hypothetical protein